MDTMVKAVAFFLLILFPISLVIFNSRFSGKQKLVGTLVSFFFSWVGFIGFYVLTLLENKSSSKTP